LGLALVHKIIVNHNGKIQVASEPGAGTTFTLTLPAGATTGTGAGA
jgi:signal transduction histidine kinase